MNLEITVCSYIAPAINTRAAAVYKPTAHWQSRFAPRFDGMRECKLFNQTALERLTACILTHYPDCKITVIDREPWN